MSKTLIIVSGTNHSGTSAVAKFLMDNGAVSGNCESSVSDILPYQKYEDQMFVQWCTQKIGFPDAFENKKEITDDMMIDYLSNDLGNADVIMLKYPKAALLLEEIEKIAEAAERKLRVVWALRNPYEAITSSVEKTGNKFDQEFFYYAATWDMVTNWRGELYPVLIERLIRYEIDVDKLLQFCGLFNPSGRMETSAICPDMFKRRLPGWRYFNLAG